MLNIKKNYFRDCVPTLRLLNEGNECMDPAKLLCDDALPLHEPPPYPRGVVGLLLS